MGVRSATLSTVTLLLILAPFHLLAQSAGTGSLRISFIGCDPNIAGPCPTIAAPPDAWIEPLSLQRLVAGTAFSSGEGFPFANAPRDSAGAYLFDAIPANESLSLSLVYPGDYVAQWLQFNNTNGIPPTPPGTTMGWLIQLDPGQHLDITLQSVDPVDLPLVNEGARLWFKECPPGIAPWKEPEKCTSIVEPPAAAMATLLPTNNSMVPFSTLFSRQSDHSWLLTSPRAFQLYALALLDRSDGRYVWSDQIQEMSTDYWVDYAGPYGKVGIKTSTIYYTDVPPPGDRPAESESVSEATPTPPPSLGRPPKEPTDTPETSPTPTTDIRVSLEETPPTSAATDVVIQPLSDLGIEVQRPGDGILRIQVLSCPYESDPFLDPGGCVPATDAASAWWYENLSDPASNEGNVDVDGWPIDDTGAYVVELSPGVYWLHGPDTDEGSQTVFTRADVGNLEIRDGFVTTVTLYIKDGS